MIQLQGDQRKDVQEFLTDKKEGLALDAKTIKVRPLRLVLPLLPSDMILTFPAGPRFLSALQFAPPAAATEGESLFHTAYGNNLKRERCVPRICTVPTSFAMTGFCNGGYTGTGVGEIPIWLERFPMITVFFIV